MTRSSHKSKFSTLRRRIALAWMLFIVPFVRRLAEGFVRRRRRPRGLLRRDDETVAVHVESTAWQLFRWERIHRWRTVSCAAKLAQLRFAV